MPVSRLDALALRSLSQQVASSIPKAFLARDGPVMIDAFAALPSYSPRYHDIMYTPALHDTLDLLASHHVFVVKKKSKVHRPKATPMRHVPAPPSQRRKKRKQRNPGQHIHAARPVFE